MLGACSYGVANVILLIEAEWPILIIYSNADQLWISLSERHESMYTYMNIICPVICQHGFITICLV